MGRVHKYGAKRSEIGGHSFPSQLEGALYQHLVFMEKGALISDIRRQPTVPLLTHPKWKKSWKPDFVVFDRANNADVYYEAKGFQTDDYLAKRLLWAYFGPAPLYVYGGSHKRLRLIETIIPLGAKIVYPGES